MSTLKLLFMVLVSLSVGFTFGLMPFCATKTQIFYLKLNIFRTDFQTQARHLEGVQTFALSSFYSCIGCVRARLVGDYSAHAHSALFLSHKSLAMAPLVSDHMVEFSWNVRVFPPRCAVLLALPALLATSLSRFKAKWHFLKPALLSFGNTWVRRKWS